MAFTDDLTARLIDPVAALELDVDGQMDAAVLVPLFVLDGEPRAVFTKRHADMRSHPGEISFPGGRREPQDADLCATALREACEEIGLAREEVVVLGALQPTSTIVTGFAVYPFVGAIAPGQAWSPAPAEVERVLELSLRELAASHARRRLVSRGMAVRTDTYCVEEHLIWGATARMVTDLLARAGPLMGIAA